MTNEKIIQMIDEYLEEPHSIHPDWVQALQICRQALIDNRMLKAEQRTYMGIYNRAYNLAIDKICEKLKKKEERITIVKYAVDTSEIDNVADEVRKELIV